MTLKRNEPLRYLLSLIGIYILWKLFYWWVGNGQNPRHAHWTEMMQQLSGIYAIATAKVLNFFGVKADVRLDAVFLIDSYRIVYIQEHCLAIPAMVLFSGAILLFPGCQGDKLWFIPIGLIGIVIINLLRLVFVAVAFQYFPISIFNFNHSYLYVILTYSLILGMVIWWMKRSTPRIA